MTFREFYDNKYPYLCGRWGVPGELLTDIYERMADTMAEFAEAKINKIIKDLENV